MARVKKRRSIALLIFSAIFLLSSVYVSDVHAEGGTGQWYDNEDSYNMQAATNSNGNECYTLELYTSVEKTEDKVEKINFCLQTTRHNPFNAWKAYQNDNNGGGVSLQVKGEYGEGGDAVFGGLDLVMIHDDYESSSDYKPCTRCDVINGYYVELHTRNKKKKDFSDGGYGRLWAHDYDYFRQYVEAIGGFIVEKIGTTAYIAGPYFGYNVLQEYQEEAAGSRARLAAAANSDDSDSDDVKDCHDGAKGAGWILCTMLEGAASVVEYLYKKFIEPALEVNTSMFTPTEDGDGNKINSAVYDGWSIFQNIANIVVIILTLIIVLSQLTGIGINNYGIKKILPRLIVGIVLINLSYIICELTVDASNILGYSLKNMFKNIPVDYQSAVLDEESNLLANGIEVGATVVGLVALIANAGALLAGSMGIVITAVLAIGSAAISIFFLFLVLSARQAGVIIFTIISPIAFALYMLPNTKKYFDKWVKIFSALLILYPLCGLLMGGSDFVSRILLSCANGHFMFTLSALLVDIVPFFFIPTLLTKSMAGLGNLGATIRNRGQQLGRNTSQRIENTDRVKRARERSNKLSQEARANGRYNMARSMNGWLEQQAKGKGWVARRAKNRLNSRGYQSRYASRIRDWEAVEQSALSDRTAIKPEQIQAREAVRENTENEASVKSISTLISSGKFERGGKVIQPTDLKGLAATLHDEASKPGGGDYATMQALYQALEAQGDAALDALADTGIMDDVNVDGAARRQLLTNIKNNPRNKASNPTLFKTAVEQLNNMNASPATGAFKSSKKASYTNNLDNGEYYDGLGANDIRGLSDKEFDKFVEHIKNNAGGAAAQKALEALNSPDANLKGNQSDRISKALGL